MCVSSLLGSQKRIYYIRAIEELLVLYRLYVYHIIYTSICKSKFYFYEELVGGHKLPVCYVYYSVAISYRLHHTANHWSMVTMYSTVKHLILIAFSLSFLIVYAEKDCIRFGGQFNVFLDSRNVLRTCKLPDGA